MALEDISKHLRLVSAHRSAVFMPVLCTGPVPHERPGVVGPTGLQGHGGSAV